MRPAPRAKLEARGLSASSSHVSLDALRTNFDGIADACERIGFTQLFHARGAARRTRRRRSVLARARR
ncbi:MAG: hypothetical protein WDN30_03270 [Pararobbsia sp.]